TPWGTQVVSQRSALPGPPVFSKLPPARSRNHQPWHSHTRAASSTRSRRHENFLPRDKPQACAAPPPPCRKLCRQTTPESALESPPAGVRDAFLGANLL